MGKRYSNNFFGKIVKSLEGKCCKDNCGCFSVIKNIDGDITVQLLDFDGTVTRFASIVIIDFCGGVFNGKTDATGAATFLQADLLGCLDLTGEIRIDAYCRPVDKNEEEGKGFFTSNYEGLVIDEPFYSQGCEPTPTGVVGTLIVNDGSDIVVSAGGDFDYPTCTGATLAVFYDDSGEILTAEIKGADSPTQFTLLSPSTIPVGAVSVELICA